MNHGIYTPGGKRSPLRLTRRLLMEWDNGEKMWSKEWKVLGPIRAAQFRSVGRPDWYGVLHPSTKEIGRWQFSTFDDEGAWGDVVRDTPEQAIKSGLDGYGKWKLESVIAADGTRYGRKKR